MSWSDVVIAVPNIVAASAAAYAAWRSAQAADRSVKAADRSAVAAEQQVAVASAQKQLAQRQFVTAVWEKMSWLQPIDPQNPAPVELHKALNALEFVAVCCEGGMLDVAIVKRTFAERYIEIYDMIKACGRVPTMQNKTGVDLLRDNRAAMSFYDELVKDMKDTGKLAKT